MGLQPLPDGGRPVCGRYLSVVESIAKLVAAGFEHKRAYLSFQEYFERLRTEAERWGKPMAAVLGALMAQVDLGAGAIGGKDSMSGSFEDEAGELNVPPTLISFAVAVGRAARAVSPEFKGLTHRVVRIAPATYGEDYRPDAQQLLAAFDAVEALTATGNALAISTPGYGCGARASLRCASQPDRYRACRGCGRGELLHPALRQLYRRARR